MKIYKISFFVSILTFCFSFTQAYTQTDSSDVKISLLTCAPGEELYSTFGHTAIRVQDGNNGTDNVFNYGLFRFDDPNFYSKFIRGKLLYMLGVQPFEEFIYEYQATNRSVWEQEIALSFQQKQQVIRFLQHNLLPENCYYHYDFIYDNCATRARDVLLSQFPQYHLEKPFLPEKHTARNLFYYYLDNGKNQAWSKLGIDILLGSGVDTTMNNYSGMFLPEFLMKAFDNISYQGKPIVLSTKLLVQGDSIKASNYYAPLISISIFCMFIFFLYYWKRKSVFLVGLLDNSLLFITGILGCLLLFTWFGTDHQSLKENYNLLWAFPLNIIVAFIKNKSGRWLRIYFSAMCLMQMAILVGWKILPQQLNIALIPFIALLLYRFYILYTKCHKRILP